MSSAVVCIATSRDQIRRMIGGLKESGFSESVISVLFLDPETTRRFAGEHHTASAPGMSAGATAGGILGGLIGLSTGLAALIIPGSGLVLAAGPVFFALTGLELGIAGAGGAMIGSSLGGLLSSRSDAGGASAGSIAGGLIGLGLTAAAALEYEARLHTGDILLAVQGRDEAEVGRAGAILLEEGGHDILSLALPPRPAGCVEPITDVRMMHIGSASRG